MQYLKINVVMFQQTNSGVISLDIVHGFVQRSSIAPTAIKMSPAEESRHDVILASLVLQSKAFLKRFVQFSRSAKFLNPISRPVRASHVMIMRYQSFNWVPNLINVRVSLR